MAGTTSFQLRPGRTAVVFLVALTVLGIANSSFGCLACYQPPYRTVLEKIEASAQAVVARTVEETPNSWQGKVVHVLRGDEVPVDQLVSVAKSLDAKMVTGDLRLLRRWNADFAWGLENPVDQQLFSFLAGAAEVSSRLPKDASFRHQAQALRYFLPFLEDAQPQIADSAYAKLASAPYKVLRQFAANFDPEQLLVWIENRQIAQKRGSLYVTLLGICGGKRELTLIDRWVKAGWETQSSDNLAAMLTAHAELNGDETVRFIEQSYIQNRDRTLGELIAAVTALRVHGEADARISRDRIQASFHLLLRERPQLVELIIDDCARWTDWSIAPQLMEIYAGGQQPWNNAMIIKYLEACPLPMAQRFVEAHGESVRKPTDNAD